jgi:primosomal protein N' (replication factor Y) (superfamily II helicase)
MLHRANHEIALLPVEGEAVGVVVPRPLKGPLDYRVPEGMALARGDIVEVPLGRSGTSLGVVWGPGEGTFERAKLKEVVRRFDVPPLKEDLLRFLAWVANYVVAPVGDVINLVLRVPDALEPERERKAIRLGAHQLAKLTDARARVLAVAADGLARKLGELAEAAGVTTQVVKGLVKLRALEEVTLPPYRAGTQPDPAFAGPSLSTAQSRAAAHMIKAVNAHRFEAMLLDGVTGSGKTETYFEAVAAALAQGKQSLILLPEIALTVQFLERFAKRFGIRPAEWHSDLTQAQRRRTWRAVMLGDVRVVVGARSALFLPFKELGLIVVDEEHDTAFKQEEGLVYHARDMAVVRANMESCPIVLSSATPSLESWVNAESGRYARLHLPERHGRATLPEAALIDMRREETNPGEFLSPTLTLAVAETVAQGEQAMLFLNRRGFAPLTLCKACGHKMGCPRCTSWLVEHRYRRKLVCHHCGYDRNIPPTCPECKTAGAFIACGPGVERVAEEVARKFPNARTNVASSDTMAGPRQIQLAIEAVANHEVDILIGTQIVAKGHNFPMLTLVGVVDGDLGLEGADPRARERTFQLLHQVSGRAGRADRPGRVLVQTTDPNHQVLKAIASGDRDAFYAAEWGKRETAGLPPFGRMAALILSGRKEPLVHEAGEALAACAPNAKGVQVWGPAPAPLSMIRGQTRLRLAVHADRTVNLQAYLRTWLDPVKLPSAVSLTIDVDPQSFL